jgi:enoyl-CoA hydratase
MNLEHLLLEIDHGIATITVNRPAALNALTMATLEELSLVVARVETDPEIRVAIITGAGSKAFIAGADIAMMREMDPVQARGMASRAHHIFAAIEGSNKVFIAAVNGYALGGGCELAMACDMRVAAATARFGQPEINLGILPGFGGSQRLPRLIGKGRALEMILSGEMIDASEAHRIGLANRVVPQTELLAETRNLAGKIATKGLVALRLCKEAVGNGLEMDLARGCSYETELFAFAFATRDQKEGMAAFLEKRAALFTDS